MVPILIVDDSREDALLAQRVLAQCKLLNPAILLQSGDQCLDYFEGVAPFRDRKLPCLVLLDMVMAPLSGLDVLQKLQSQKAGSMFVMLSGLTDLKSIHQGYQLGARTFLIKPLRAEDVMQMLDAISAISVEPRAGGYELLLNNPGSARLLGVHRGGDPIKSTSF
jgi:response regulator of citrate/malate metabolism